MNEKLIIRNFGPIKSIELDLRKFNILIGEQATGKSTVAKVFAMCRYFSYIIRNDKPEQPFQSGLISWGIFEEIKEDTYIYYECVHYSFEIRRTFIEESVFNRESASFTELGYSIFISNLEAKSSEFKELLVELSKVRPDPDRTIPTSFFTNEVAKLLDNPFYLHTERALQSIFSLGRNSIQNISDSLFNQFARLDQISRQFGLDTNIEPLDIVYKNEQGKGYIRKKSDDVFFSLNNAASGYQSTVPLVLLIRYYNEMLKKSKTFIIEEPEMNIFPIAQQRMMQFLVERTVKYGNMVLLTTHSPYILTSLNNMAYAYCVGRNHETETEKIVERKYWINPSDVSAYMLMTDGSCEDIFDRDESLIKADKIDGITGVLNEQFNALLNIEFEEK